MLFVPSRARTTASIFLGKQAHSYRVIQFKATCFRVPYSNLLVLLFCFVFQKCLLSLGYVNRIFMSILIVNSEYQFWIPLFIFAFKLKTSDEFQNLMIFISINKPCTVMSIIFSGNDTNQKGTPSFLFLF